MRILMMHTRYQLRGGEDESAEIEAAMLRRHGHEVRTYFRDNSDLEGVGLGRVALRTIWNQGAYRETQRIIRSERPDVVHVQNTFPLLSPAIIQAASRSGVPVVQSLRNYRLMCLSATMFRRGVSCELCVGANPLAGVRHGCYRGSRAASAVVAAMLLTHRSIGTWSRAVTRFIAPSEFTRQKYLEGGFDAASISVKPNMIDPDPGIGTGGGGFVLFVGRLSEEKGLASLLAAWRLQPRPGRLVIIGEGPLGEMVREAAVVDSGVEWIGRRSLVETLEMMGSARAVVVPSECHETFGRVAVESFAKGTPVIASRAGGLPELVIPGENGWLFEPGNVAELSVRLDEAFDEGGSGPSRVAARASFLRHFTADRNHEILRDIYKLAISEARTRDLAARA